MKQLSKRISSTKNETFSEPIIQQILELLARQQPQYQNLDYFGKGSSSIILNATNSDNQQIALKVIVIQENIEEIERVKRKYNIQQSISKCSYFVNVNRCFYLNHDNKKKYFIIEMELCNKTLSQLLEDYRKQNIKLDDYVKNVLVILLLDSINLLHMKEVYHGNINPTNILISHNHQFKDTPFILKFENFGQSSYLKSSKSKSYTTQKVEGMIKYMSLEASKGKQRKGSDLFSLGIVLIELDNFLTFDYSKINNEDFSLLQAEGITALSKYELNQKSELFEMASIFLNPDYKQRSSALEILERFLHKQQFKNIPIYSFQTEASSQGEIQFNIPQLCDKDTEQIDMINQSIQDYLKNNQNIAQKQEYYYLKILEDFMNLNQIEKNNLEQVEKDNYFSIDYIQLATKSLYKEKQFSLFQLLGRGASSIVFAAKNLIKKRDSVIKLFFGKDKLKVRRQISILKQVSSPYIVKFYDFGFFSDEKNNEYVWFEFEKCRCTLSHFLEENIENINNNLKLKEEFALKIMDSINSLHRQGVLHGNINLNNFLVSEDESGRSLIKLTDLDKAGMLSQFKYEFQEYNIQEEKSQIIEGVNCLFQKGNFGTPVFRSPERSLCLGFPSTFASDSFSVGMCLLLLDNYLAFNKIVVLNYFYLLCPYSIPFMNCHHLFNKNNQIYRWACSLLSFHLSQRPYLREIIDQITDSPVIIYSKFRDSTSLKIINLIPSSFLFLKNITYSELGGLMNQNSAAFSSLSLLTIRLPDEEIKSEEFIFSSYITNLTYLSSITIDLSWKQIQSEGFISFSENISKLSHLSSLKMNLSNNFMESSGILQLSESIKKLIQLSSLSIHLGNNNINSEGMAYFSQSISKLINLSSLIINLKCNTIESEGIIQFSYGISKLNYLSCLSIDFGYTSIENDGMIQFSASISIMNQLSSLIINFNGNKMRNEGIIILSLGLSQLIQLSSLTIELQDNKIESEGMINFSQCISKLTQLSSLSINLYNNQIKSLGLSQFSQSISKLNNLSSFILNLATNEIEGDGFIQISSGISKLIYLSQLSIDLHGNKLKNNEMILFQSQISQLSFFSLLTMNLAYCQLERKELNSLSSGISKLIKLQSLAICLGSNQIKSEGIIQLSQHISKLAQLQSLNIDFKNNEIGNEGINFLSQGISKLTSLSSLTINLNNNQIQSEGMIQFSSNLSQLLSVTFLAINLSDNTIQSEGLIQLSSGFSKLTSLQQLTINLNNNSIKSEGIKKIQANISKLIKLQSLIINLGSNQVKSEGIIQLSSGISKLILLQSLVLDLHGNQIQSTGMKLVAQSISKLTQLSSLSIDLNGNEIDREGMIQLSSGISKIISLSSLLINLSRNQTKFKGLLQFFLHGLIPPPGIQKEKQELRALIYSKFDSSIKKSISI